MKKNKHLQSDKPVFRVAGLINRKSWLTLFNQRRSLVPFAAAILLIFGLVFGGWGTVYAAQDSLPDELLFPVKQVVEYLEDFSTMTASLDEEFLLGAAAAIDEGREIQKRDTDKDMTMDNAGSGQSDDLDPKQSQDQTTWCNGENSPECLDTEQVVLNDPLTLIEDFSTTTVTTTLEITETKIITPGVHGPGPCDPEEPGLCDPAGWKEPFGPFEGEPPEPDLRGYGPGPEQGADPFQPETPKIEGGEQPKATPNPVGDGGDGGGSETGKAGEGSKGDKP